MEDSNPDLETFRQQWRAEVTARTKPDDNKKSSTTLPARQPRRQAFKGIPSSKAANPRDHGEHIEPQPLSSLGDVSKSGAQHGESSQGTAKREPKSALEHYERAVEREDEGKLGDSLDLYRKALRMDDQVDKAYKNKHFPPSSIVSKPTKPNPSNASPTVPNPAHHSLDGPPRTFKELIASFAGLKIEPAPPAIEGTAAPPCPIADLPEEILMHIFTDVAIQDVSSFLRLAQVCKRIALVVLTEEQIWRRMCQGPEVGFGAMHYTWQCAVLGGPLDDSPEPEELEAESDIAPLQQLSREEITESLLQTAYSTSWHKMFRFRPRIRFNGCYISTVNYIRAGQAAQSQTTWSSPVHIVTYFRYLRFFRDGTVISLLTTVEPVDVVHHLTKELQETHRNGAAAYLPSIFMQKAQRGRWRLSSIVDDPTSNLKDAEGDVFVETEGANDKYLYRMKFSLGGSGKGARNNKLVWQGYWNYNILTDDTGEFTLRNDKAYHFSRVKSYGVGS